MTERIVVPRIARLLGYAGLVPFAAGAVALLTLGLGPERAWAMAGLFSYGVAILSFLGGARWGMALSAEPDAPDVGVLILSVLPSLVAAVAAGLVFVSGVLAHGALIAGFALMWLWDVRSAEPPAWYPALRTPLTIGAVLSLSVGLYASL